jgi:glutamate racemase
VADASGVAVLATESTIAGGAYQRALLAQQPALQVLGRPCPLWVTLAEQGNLASALADAILLDGVAGLVKTAETPDAPSTLLLGCTHFPVFTAQLKQLLGEGVRVVDSAQTTAATVAAAMQAQNLVADADADSYADADADGGGNVVFMATDGVQRFQRVGAVFLGEALPNVELVDL